MTDRLITRAEAAQALGISTTSLWRLQRVGALRPVHPTTRSTRFRESDVAAMVAGKQVAA
jgi:predicted DNA-binding transcriptional regulator AlpA